MLRFSTREASFDEGGPVDWPYRHFEEAWVERPLFEMFAEMAATRETQIGIVDANTRLTYGEIHCRAVALASKLIEIADREAPVAIALADGAMFPIAVLGAWAAGCNIVPLDISTPEARNALILERAGAQTVIVSPDTAGAAKRFAPNLKHVDIVAAMDPPAGPLPPARTDIGSIYYTSGSTGVPKGIHVPQRSILFDVMLHTNAFHLSENDRPLKLYPSTFRPSNHDTFGALLSGGTVFMVDPKHQGLAEIARVVREERITTLRCAPSLFRKFVELAGDAETLSSVRMLELTGDTIFGSDVTLFRHHFGRGSYLFSLTGATETGHIAYRFIDHDTELRADMRVIPVGYPVPQKGFALVGAEGENVPTGEIGEIVIASEFLPSGYWNEPELSAAVFIPSEDDPGMRCYRTGDLARLRPDGLVELAGRRDRQIKLRGLRVDLSEVEGVFRNMAEIADAAVIVRQQGMERAIIAYLTAAGETAGLKQRVAERFMAELPNHMWPSEVHFLDSIPKLATFKPNIPALEEIDREHQRAKSHIKRGNAEARIAPKRGTSPPGNLRLAAVTDAVRRSWTEVLGRVSFDENMRWDDVGGDSLQAMQMLFLLEKRLHKYFPISLFTLDMRPSHLIQALAEFDPTARAAAIVSANDTRPVLFYAPAPGETMVRALRFGEALREKVKVVPIDYALVDPFTDFNDLVEFVSHLLKDVPDEQEIGLVGYSGGGCIAFELGRALAASGRRIGFLSVIDMSPKPGSFNQPGGPGQPSAFSQLVKDLGFLSRRRDEAYRWLVIKPLLAMRADGLAGLSTRLFWYMGKGRLAAKAHWIFTSEARKIAASRRGIGFWPGKLWLFRTHDRDTWPASAPEDLGWGKYSESVEVISVKGSHSSLLDAKVDEFASRFLEIFMAGRTKLEPAVAEQGRV